MTKEEKVAAKIKELQEVANEVKCSVMVISVIDTDKEDEVCVFTGVTGYASTLSKAIARQIIRANESVLRRIIENSVAFASLYKDMEADSADVAEAETRESNNQ